MRSFVYRRDNCISNTWSHQLDLQALLHFTLLHTFWCETTTLMYQNWHPDTGSPVLLPCLICFIPSVTKAITASMYCSSWNNIPWEETEIPAYVAAVNRYMIFGLMLHCPGSARSEVAWNENLSAWKMSHADVHFDSLFPYTNFSSIS